MSDNNTHFRINPVAEKYLYNVFFFVKFHGSILSFSFVCMFEIVFKYTTHLAQSQLSQQWIVECTGFQMKSSLFHTLN